MSRASLRHVWRSRGLLVVVLVLAACSSDDAPADDAVDDVLAEDASALGEDGSDIEDVGDEEADPDPGDDGDDDEVVVEPVRLDLDLEERTLDGTTVRVTGLEVTELAILVDIEIVVSDERAFVQFNNRQQGTAARLRDDLGGEYLLVPVEGNTSLRIGGGERLEGTLSFEGTLDPDATSLQLVFNEDSDPEQTTQYDRIMPYVVFPPIPLDGQPLEEVGRPDLVTVEVDQELRVADGTTMRVSRLEVTELAILVDVEIIVAQDRTRVWLNNQMSTPALLRDEAGEEYRLVPIDGNRSLGLEGGERLEGTLSFQGPLRAGVETLQVVLNENSDPEQVTNNDRAFPHFVFDPIELQP
jgi:hypothetical protein